MSSSLVQGVGRDPKQEDDLVVADFEANGLPASLHELGRDDLRRLGDEVFACPKLRRDLDPT